MRYFPINLDVSGRKALVVGGGPVARRKAKGLLACGALVTAVSPAFCPGFLRLAGVRRVTRRYRKGDLRGARLVVCATDSPEVNRLVGKHASSAGIPVNVVDQPALCTFIVPAVMKRGGLTIAVSTGGGSPSLSRRIRERLQKEIGPAFGRQLALLREMRPRVKAAGLDPAARKRLLLRLAGSGIHRVIVRKGLPAARRLARAMLASAARSTPYRGNRVTLLGKEPANLTPPTVIQTVGRGCRK